ncbi:protein of unknown function (plasmid) [Cupriavidus taiwanensis]|uniref:Uncharacterized protein n=1 Tax=Cupriavidus taiwanensis TaxID=164546 RepID=A0A9Q7XT70_9BURK|nr:protein of unknown function [Cupriavidus taiwanensis]
MMLRQKHEAGVAAACYLLREDIHTDRRRRLALVRCPPRRADRSPAPTARPLPWPPGLPPDRVNADLPDRQQ